MITVDGLAFEFETLLGVTAPSDSGLRDQAAGLLSALSSQAPHSRPERARRLIALVNSKFEINADTIAEVYSHAAQSGITFNYHEKLRISEAFDRNDPAQFQLLCSQKGLPHSFSTAFYRAASQHETLAVLQRELASPTLVRKDSSPRDWSTEILSSLFGGFIFNAYPLFAVHGYLDPSTAHTYEPDFWKHLHRSRPSLFSRKRTLAYLKFSPRTKVEQILGAVRFEFSQLANHGTLAIQLEGWDDLGWRAAGIITLFAEKFQLARISNGFFRPGEIEAATRRHVPISNIATPDFPTANLGFHYKDTFVFGDADVSTLLLVFQKNVADETVIPCPTCRSSQVHGNSYSSLGVKSWECGNLLCPDRSKFNRGKRYSFLQLLKQAAIENDENLIPVRSVRVWSRDVQPLSMVAGISTFLLRHYSLAGDGVVFVNADAEETLSRKIDVVDENSYLQQCTPPELLTSFRKLPLFQRFVQLDVRASRSSTNAVTIGLTTAINEDSTLALRGIPADTFDGAVTSPPYYNARAYSQWENIYCYLFDIYNNARSVFRCLKPGGYYLFNIFDYFDNENTIAKSAMGEKRMILSAYCIDLFERCGYSVVGNVVWDKGEIEGKRAFNGGNFSPYYQAPLNCWEHILIFRKPGAAVTLARPFPSFLRAKPVHKMVKGENRHGHSAPYPEAVPKLLLDRLAPVLIATEI